MRGLRDKRIIVAGGATGIGAATAELLAEEGALATPSPTASEDHDERSP